VHYRYAFLANAFTPHEHAKTFAIRKHRHHFTPNFNQNAWTLLL
jgi:hypothetical protein